MKKQSGGESPPQVTTAPAHPNRTPVVTAAPGSPASSPQVRQCPRSTVRQADLRGLTGGIANGFRVEVGGIPGPRVRGTGAPSFVDWKYHRIGATRPSGSGTRRMTSRRPVRSILLSMSDSKKTAQVRRHCAIGARRIRNDNRAPLYIRSYPV